MDAAVTGSRCSALSGGVCIRCKPLGCLELHAYSSPIAVQAPIPMKASWIWFRKGLGTGVVSLARACADAPSSPSMRIISRMR